MIEHAGVSLDPARHAVSYQGTPVTLTAMEFQLLHQLLARPGHVLTRERLADGLYGWQENGPGNTLEVLIHNLRRKLDSRLIRTVRADPHRARRRLPDRGHAMIAMRTRILLPTLLLVVIGSLGLVLSVLRDHHREIENVYDAQLVQAARVLQGLLRQMPADADWQAIRQALDQAMDQSSASILSHPYEINLAFQIWRSDGKLLMRSADAPPLETTCCTWARTGAACSFRTASAGC